MVTKVNTMRSQHPALFLSKKERKKIILAIREAEKETSAEIRVHLAKGNGKEVLDHAKEIFEKIGMTKTKHRNSILIFLSVKSKRFAVLGDRAIHEKVPQDFWEKVIQKMNHYFKEGRFGEGIIEAVRMVSKELKIHFPRQADDTNELSDQISYSH